MELNKADRRRAYEQRTRVNIIANLKQALGSDFEPMPASRREFAALNTIKDAGEMAQVWAKAVEMGDTKPKHLRTLVEPQAGKQGFCDLRKPQEVQIFPPPQEALVEIRTLLAKLDRLKELDLDPDDNIPPFALRSLQMGRYGEIDRTTEELVRAIRKMMVNK